MKELKEFKEFKEFKERCKKLFTRASNHAPPVTSPFPEPLPYNAQTDSPLTIFLARRGMTIKDFARKAELNYHHVLHALRGRYPNVRMSTVDRMAKVAGMRPDHMYEYIKLEIEWRNRNKQEHEQFQGQENLPNGHDE